MENTLQNNSKTVAAFAAVAKWQKRMVKSLLSFCIVFSMLMGINVMGYAQNGTQPVTQKTCSITKGGAAVNFTVAGQLPDNARVSATAVTRTMPNGSNALGAYDITITKGRSTWQPAAGQPVQVTISDPAFTDGTPLTVYHEGDNGLEFVAIATPSNHAITFPARSFSVYIVGLQDEDARLKVNFHQADGNVVTIYVKPADLGEHFNTVLYDPGAGTLPTNTQFRGWIQDVPNYTGDHVSQAKDISGVRAIVRQMLNDGVSEGDQVDFYAMYFKSFLVVYLDENGATLGSHDILIPGSSSATSTTYRVNMGYTPQDNNHAFMGWQPNSGCSNISGCESATTVYPNNTDITISGDVVFGVNSPEGHWLVFDENGKGGKYNAPQFVRSGQVTQRPVPDDEMIRFGYTFGGWYTNAACTAGNEFTFGNTLSDNITIYAKWIANTTAYYTVIIWTQNVSANGYDFKESIRLSGNVGTNINTVTISGTAGNDNSYVSVAGTRKQYTGFHLDHLDQNVQIKTEGNAILNVYYNRTSYTLTFRRYQNSGTVYKTITALYEQPIGNNFPISVNGTTDYRWEPHNSSTFNQVLVYIDVMPAENVTFSRNDANYSTKYMEFWVEALPGQTGTRTFNGKSFVKYGNTIPAKYNFFTEAEDFVNLAGYEHFGSDPAFGTNGRAYVDDGGTLYLYYTRLAYPITYMDGAYFDGDGNTLTETDRGLIHETDDIPYESNLTSYNKGGDNFYNPTPSDGFVFECWCIDKAGTQPYTFTTMPKGGITLYAKWRQIQYRVFLHPNAGTQSTDPSLFWGTTGQKMNFRISYGGKVSAPTGTRNNYEFVGWYKDAACTNAFNADAFILNETNVTAAYDKTTDFTDDMDIWGNGATWNSDIIGYNGADRFWITKKLDIYAKWRATVDGAIGIGIVYDVTGGSPARTDNRLYQDNVSANAAAAPVSSDATKVFSHWQVQRWNGSNYEDVPGDTVLPGAPFTVLKSLSKAIVTKWQNPANTNDIREVTNPQPGINPPDATHTKIYEATYTMQLRAVYIPIEEPTPTHITWFKHDGSEALVREDGPDDLDINEAVNIPTLAEVGTYTGHTFLGWYRGSETTAASVSATAAPNFLWYKANNGKYYAESSFENEATQVAADERTPYHNLFAAWRPNTYTVHFNENATSGVTGSMNDQNFVYDVAQNLTVNAFEREGYCFQGWSTTATGSVQYTDQQEVSNLTAVDGATVDLYAVWQQNLTPDFNLDDNYCYGENVPLSNTSPNGVAGTWKYNGQTVTQINTTTVGAATYTFTPNDLTCSQPYEKTITVNPRASATIEADPAEVCAGNSTTLSVAAAQSYAWSTGDDEREISVTPTATNNHYSVTVTAVGGCETVGQIDITVNPNPSFTTVTAHDEKCLKKGDILVTVSGGTPGTTGYQYIINGATDETTTSTSHTFVDLVADHSASTYDGSGITYTLKVIDSKGCSATTSAVIKLHPEEITLTTPVNISICSGNSFSFKPTVTSDPIMYTWDTPSMTCLTGGTANTTPSLEVTGELTLADGCTTGSATYTLHPTYGTCTLPDIHVDVDAIMAVRPPVSLSFSDPGTVCGGSDVDITLTVANAVNGSTLNWKFGDDGKPYQQIKTNTTTGDASQTFTQSFTMPDSCTATINLHVDYLDNAAPGDACDASKGYDFQIGIKDWTLPAGGTATVACASQAVKPADSALPTDVKDGCNNTLTPTYVGVTPADYATSITCSGTVVYTYRYKDCAGTEKDWTYTYTVTGPTKPTIALASGMSAVNNLGCNPTEVVPQLTYENFVVTDACNSSAKATVTDGGITATNCDRTQIWTATYTNACNVSADPVTVSYNWKATTQPIISTDLDNLIVKDVCNWNGTDGAPSATDFTVTTGDACATSTAATVSPATAVQDGCFKTQVFTASYTNTCGQSASKSVTVKWPYDETNPTIGTIADQNALAAENCKYKIPDLSTVAVNAAQDVCSTPTFVSQNPAKDAEYAQTGAQQTIPVVVTVKDDCGNTATQTVNVIIPAKLSVTAAANPAAICINSTSTLTATPANATGTVEYIWTPSASISGSGATVTAAPTTIGTTTYTVSATDVNGCSATNTVDVTVSEELKLSITPAKQHICNGGAINDITITSSTTSLSVTGLPAGVEMSGATISGTPTSNTAATYNFTVTANSTSACPAKSVSGTIIVPDPITVDVTATTPATCANHDGTATVTAAGGAGPLSYSYAFKYPEQHTGVNLNTLTTANPTNLDTAVYIVTVTDSVGCYKTAEFTVGVESNFSVSVSADPVVVCSGGSFSIVPTVTPSTLTGTTYTWDAPDQDPPGSVSGTAAQTTPSDDIHGTGLVNETDQVATLTYTVQPANGICTATPIQVQVQVSVSFYPQVTITAPDYNVCPNVGTQTLVATFDNVNTNVDTVTWVFNGGTPEEHRNVVSTTDNTDSYDATVPSDNCNTFYTYTVSYKDNRGCKNSATGKVTVVLADGIVITGGTNQSDIECPADTVAPHTLTGVMPTVKDACGQDISSTYVLTSRPTFADDACEGNMPFEYTYTDCDGHTTTWTYTYHVKRTTKPAEVGGPVATSDIVQCVADAVEPTLPTVKDVCGKELTNPTKVVTDAITNCRGTRTYTYTYKDCVDSAFVWEFVYTINPTTAPVVNATGIQNSKTVECIVEATAPTTIPKAMSTCDDELTGELTSTTDAPNPIVCEGTRTYTYTYTDCAGQTATWNYVYTITKKDFTMPSNEGTEVSCIAQATQPTPPTVTDNCGGTLTVTGPVEGGTYDGCEGTKTYTWTYTDCSGRFSHDWVYTYTIERADFTAPTPAGTTVDCISDAVAPHTLTGVMPTVKDNCGNTLLPVEPLPTTYTATTYDGCSGDVTYTYTYKDCEGNTHNWVYTYTISAPAAPTVSGWPSNQTGINSCYAGRPDFPADADVLAYYTAACSKAMSVKEPSTDNVTSGDDCGWSITREYVLTDGCNTVKPTITYSGSDQTKPAIATGYPAAVPASVTNCVFTYPDLRDTVRKYSTDNCTAKEQLAITQSPAQGTGITPSASAQTLPVTITVKDKCENDSVITINVTVPATMTMSITDYASQCYNTADGYIEYQIVGGEADYTVTLDGTTDKTATQTAAGTYTFTGLADGAYTLTVEDANGCEATANATIEQIQETLTITANSNFWTYDGNAHSDPGFTVTFGTETHTVASGNTVTLNNNDVISNISITGTITNVTESPQPNVVGTGITITRGTEDVTCYYNLKTVNGQLNITNSTAMTLTCEDKSKEYDGTALSYTATPSVTTGTTVSYSTDGGTTWSTTVPSITNVSESPLTVDVKAENSNYATANCQFTLTITPKPLTITVNDTKVYDGSVLVSGLAKATATGLISGDNLTAGEVTTSGKNVGTYTYSSTATISVPFATTLGIDNYNVTYTTSQIITKATVTLVSADLSKEYDGIALVNGTTPLTTESGWVSGEGATYTFTGSQLDKGTSPNSFDIVPNTNTDLNNYDIQKTEGTLEVLKNTTEILLTANSNEKFYDGTPLVDPGYSYNTSLLAASDTIVAVVQGTRTHVGTTPNVITEYHAYRGMKGGAKAIEDVTDNYTITPVNGTLEVKKQKVTITAGSGDYDYDGAVHTNSSYVVNGLVSPDDITATTSGSIQFPSQSPQANVIDSWSFTTGDPNDYDVETVNGTLTMSCTPVTLAITADSYNEKYDGAAHSKNSYKLVVGTGSPINVTGATYTFANGDELTVNINGSITHVAESNVTNEITSYTIMHGTTDMTTEGCYTVTTTNGTLAVTCRNITLTSGDASKTYDGTPLSKETVTVSGDGFVTGEGATYSNFNSITNVSENAANNNTFDYDFNTGTTASDYCVTPAYGTLTINPLKNVEVVVTEHSAEYDYDGTAKTVTGYDLTSISDPLYTAADFSFVGPQADSTVTQTEVGHYPMGITANDFQNNNTNFEDVIFTVVDGFLDIYPQMIIPATYDVVPVTCYGDGDGAVSIPVTGGKPGNPQYTYNVTGPATYTGSTNTPLVLTNLNPGTYNVTITDGLGYEATTSFDITQPDPLVATITVPTSCPNQPTYPVSVAVTGGNSGYTYVWSADATDVNAASTTVAMQGTNDCGHEYTATVNVTDAKSCKTSDTKKFTVVDTEDPDFTAPADLTICRAADGTFDASLTVAGEPDPTTYSDNCTTDAADFTMAHQDLDTLPASDLATRVVRRQWTLTDLCGNKTSKIQNITINPTVVMDTPADQTICSGENVTVDFTTTVTDGTMTYDWTSSNTTTITGLAASGSGNISATTLTNTEATAQTTTITVTPTYSNNGKDCVGDPVTFTITVKPTATGMNNETAYIKCNGDAFSVTPTGTKIPANTQYTWTVTPNTDVTGYSDQTTPVDAPISQALTNTSTTLQTVVYNVTAVTDGCNGETFTISVDVEPTPTLSISCPPAIEKTVNFGECEAEILPTELGTPTYTHSLGWTVTVTNDAPADNMYPIGDNIVTWTIEDECGNTASCEQHVVVKFPPCPDAVDGDGKVYTSVRIDCECWTTRNLESEHYSDGTTPIPGVYNYTSSEYPNTTENVNNFGRLYDWPSVMNGGTLNAYNHVQGICPAGWYVPTAAQYESLNAHGADALKDNRFWLDGGGSNTTGFTSLPGGYYDGSIQRYLNLMGEAYYWSTTLEGGVPTASASGMRYNCDFVYDVDVREGLGYSVRCIKEKE